MLEFSDDGQSGKIKVIKTRDILIVEAHVHFDIENEISNDDVFEFPDDTLLINAPNQHFKNVKDVFKKKPRQEILKLQFMEDELKFEGDIDRNHKFSVRSELFDGYKKYLDNGHEHPSNFEIWLRLVHLNGILKICEILQSNFQAVMELTSEEDCFTLYFTKTHAQDFTFIIGIPDGSI